MATWLLPSACIGTLRSSQPAKERLGVRIGAHLREHPGSLPSVRLVPVEIPLRMTDPHQRGPRLDGLFSLMREAMLELERGGLTRLHAQAMVLDACVGEPWSEVCGAFALGGTDGSAALLVDALRRIAAYEHPWSFSVESFGPMKGRFPARTALTVEEVLAQIVADLAKPWRVAIAGEPLRPAMLRLAAMIAGARVEQVATAIENRLADDGAEIGLEAPSRPAIARALSTGPDEMDVLRPASWSSARLACGIADGSHARELATREARNAAFQRWARLPRRVQLDFIARLSPSEREEWGTDPTALFRRAADQHARDVESRTARAPRRSGAEKQKARSTGR